MELKIMTESKIPKILVNGANGKMGTLACETILNSADLELVGKAERCDNLIDKIKSCNPDIVLDLTNAKAVFQNSLDIINSNTIPVIGSSGLTAQHVIELDNIMQSKNLGGLIIPNFSISAVLMMHTSKIAAKYFNDVNIIEKHHKAKIDAPSGTALRTADLIAANMTCDSENLLKANHHQETVPHALGAYYKNINIHSIRQSGTVATQTVTFSNNHESFEITQNSIDRQSFMPGIILACKKAININKLVIGLENLIF
tara:strand:+ start:19784 stop:20557 length:774 start_codon:yes stop_codon:yes gene_type:complete